MYDYFKGKIQELSPTELILEVNNVGYKILISLQTFGALKDKTDTKIYLHHHLREDAELLFGFNDKDERRIFTFLIEVSGIGPNTARTMLSYMSSEEIEEAIFKGDVNKLKSIKGIGLKTAQRIIIDLKDKIKKGETSQLIPGSFVENQSKTEASTALILLGFNKSAVDKIIDQLIKESPQITLEELIKQSLKRL